MVVDDCRTHQGESAAAVAAADCIECKFSTYWTGFVVIVNLKYGQGFLVNLPGGANRPWWGTCLS